MKTTKISSIPSLLDSKPMPAATGMLLRLGDAYPQTKKVNKFSRPFSRSWWLLILLIAWGMMSLVNQNIRTQKLIDVPASGKSHKSIKIPRNQLSAPVAVPKPLPKSVALIINDLPDHQISKDIFADNSPIFNSATPINQAIRPAKSSIIPKLNVHVDPNIAQHQNKLSRGLSPLSEQTRQDLEPTILEAILADAKTNTNESQVRVFAELLGSSRHVGVPKISSNPFH